MHEKMHQVCKGLNQVYKEKFRVVFSGAAWHCYLVSIESFEVAYLALSVG